MANKQPKVELKLLKKLSDELQATLDVAQNLSTDGEDNLHRFILEMSKASGLAAGIAQEGSLLVKDIYAVIRTTETGAVSSDSYLNDLFGIVPNKPNTN